MQVQELRIGSFEAHEVVHRCDAGAWLYAKGPDGGDELVFVPESAEVGQREQQRLREIACPGMPAFDLHATSDGSVEAIRYLGLGAARPLHEMSAFPTAALRAALARLLSVLSQAHSRGWVHARISRSLVMADPSGSFWLLGWAEARPAAGRVRTQAGLDDVGRDLRDLALALLRFLLHAPLDQSGELADEEIDRAAEILRPDDPELARVLARMAAVDLRECYESATEVLTDLGEPDQSIHDPWSDLPLAGRRHLVRHAMRHLDRAGGPEGGLASLDFVGAPGSGKSRLLSAMARAARDRGWAVLILEGRSTAQPWGAIGDLVRQLLGRAPLDAEVRKSPVLQTLLDSTSTIPRPPATPGNIDAGDAVTGVLADLAQAALGAEHALILLDDEDALSAHGRRAWRCFSRFVGDASDTHQAVRALCVSTSTRSYDAEPIVRRETVHLPDLRRRHVQHMLGGALVEPGMAAALVEDVYRLAGGRPGEVIEHLKVLVTRGVLRPVGRRWRLVEFQPDHSTIAIAETTRRALTEAGPDATRLAEFLAVGADLRLQRRDLLELAEIPAHRFQSAADAAERAGLVIRDGATWRLRTESVRARMNASLPDDRSRTLHRELLFRLLEVPTETQDLPAIARHGRAAADPRAANWTRSALKILRVAHRHSEVVSHYEEGRDLIDPAGIDFDLRLDYCESLAEIGRLAESIGLAHSIGNDPNVPSPVRARGLINLAVAFRLTNDWERLRQLVLPDEVSEPEMRAQLRLLRACAYAYFTNDEASLREERLAGAELRPADAPSPAVTSLSHYLHYFRHRQKRSFDQALIPLLKHIRCERKLGSDTLLITGLDLYALCLTNIRRNDASLQVLHRAEELASSSRSVLLQSRAAAGRSILYFNQGKTTRSLRAAEEGWIFAARTGSISWERLSRVGLLLRRVQCDKATYVDRAFLTDYFNRFDEEHLAFALAHGAYFAIPLLYFGFHEVLGRLVAEAKSRDCARIHKAALICAYVHSCLYLNVQLDDVLIIAGTSSERSLGIALRTVPGPDTFLALSKSPEAPGIVPDQEAQSCALLAYAIRHGNASAGNWSNASTIDLRGMMTKEYYFGESDLALALLTEDIPESIAQLQVDKLQVDAAIDRKLPTSLEWKRLSALALGARRRGDYATAERYATDARTQLQAVLRTSMGPRGEALFDYGCRLQARLGLGEHSGPQRRRVVTASRSTSRDGPFPSVWSSSREVVRRGTRRILLSRHPAELLCFVSSLGPTHEMRLFAPNDVVRRELGGERSLIVAHLINTWTADALRGLLMGVLSDPEVAMRVLVTASSDTASLRERSGVHLALTEALGCVAEVLPPLLRDPSERECAILWRWWKLNPDLGIPSEALLHSLAVHGWPGGVSELDAALREVACAVRSGCDDVRLDVNSMSGLANGAFAHRGMSSDLVATILAKIDRAASVSVRDLDDTRAPRRTIQRRLDELVKAGALERTGRGRATRYSRRERIA